jgi:outer membrane protein insertion porin family
VIAADAGYFSESGLTGEATWTHRNFFGGARTLTARATAQTGLGAFVDDPDRLYRVSLTLRQPYVVDYRFALSGSAFAEDRETFLDESTAFGGSATLTYAPAPLTTASLRYDFETRNVRSFGFDFAGDSTAIRLIDVFNFLLLDTGRIDQSILSLSGTYGLVDNPLSPRRGFLLNPSIEFAGPAPVSSVEYSRLRIRANGFVPLTRSVGLRARLTGGWLAPFGQSLPSEQRDGFFTLLQLRSNAFFAGGTGDVRGWGDNLLGPKILDLTFREAIDETTSDTTVVFTASPYFPVGSLTKLAGSLGVDLPFPGLGPRWGTHAFIDGGRVWTTDERFDPGGGFLVGSAYGDEERFFFSVGGGVSVATPIGDVRLSLGYKLNPSFFDLRDPTDIAAAVERVFLTNEDPTNAQVEAAIRAVEPAELPVFQLFSIPERSRYHIHFSIGQTF